MSDTKHRDGEPWEWSEPTWRKIVGRARAGRSLLGWHEGIPGMKEGGKRKLFIPPELAYKDQGSPDGSVKPGAKVIYLIEIAAIVNEPG